MGDASYLQLSFLGGEWAPSAQGRADHEEYRSSLNLCYNGLPTEVGAWTRRAGTRLYGPTRLGRPGILREFHFTQAKPYLMEFTDGYLRLHSGPDIATEGQVHVGSTAATTFAGKNAIQVTTDAPHGRTVGDTVVFQLLTLTSEFVNIARLLGRQFSVVSVTDASTVVLVDALLNEFDGSRVTLGTNSVRMSKVTEFVTPYTNGAWSDIRVVQDEDNALILEKGFSPRTLTVTTPATDTDFAVFSLDTATFTDGPYLDPPTDGTTLTAGGLTSPVTLVASKRDSINKGAGFQTSDIGRMIRLFSEPEPWDSSASYSKGDSVTYGGVYWTALKDIASGHNGQPDISINIWAISTTAAIWTWGTITAITNSETIVVDLADADPEQVKAGGPLLYSTPIRTWRLGLYSDTTAWPSCGTFHQGRLWLASPAFSNRIDSGKSDVTFDFAPTLYDGTVADDCGISAVFRSDDINSIYWMLSDHSGIVIGTQAGEWALQASSLSDPITPTSIQVHRVTKFGSENVEPRRTGMASIFVRRFGRKLTEYISDVYSGKYSGTNLSLKAAHFMSRSPIAEIAYQQETTPVVWVRLEDGQLLGMTYRRDSPFGTQPASFSGWHQHALGTGETVLSIQGGPSVDGDRDTLSLLVQDPTTGFCYVEAMTDLFGDEDTLPEAWFLDGAVTPSGVDYFVTGDGNFLRFYGLDYWIGKTVTAWIGGIDGGDYVIPPDGTLDVPVDTNANPDLTASNLLDVTALGYANSVTAHQVGGSPGTSYLILAEENYSPDYSARINLGTLPDTLVADTQALGFGYDRVRRKLRYPVIIAETATTTNSTGFNRWSGFTGFDSESPLVPPGGTYSNKCGSLYLAEKDIDTGDVIFYDTFDINKTVPVGIGNGDVGFSDGTWRRIIFDLSPFGGNTPLLTNPYNGDVWMHVQSCELYLFRAQDNYAQVISPYVPQFSQNDAVIPVGVTADWLYAWEEYTVGPVQHIHILPSTITPAEVTADYLLATYDYAYLTDLAGARVLRHAVASDGYLYAYGTVLPPTGPRKYVLHKCVPGTGWSDITPWSSSTGPNTSIGVYDTLAFNEDPKLRGNAFLWYLPATNDLIAITKLQPQDSTGSEPFRLDCTYVNLTSPSFDYHEGFVSSYMTEDWVPTTSGGAWRYLIHNVREVDPYLNMTDYLYSDADYTRRWFAFVVQDQNNAETFSVVLVQYQFISGQAPAVLQILSETDTWDANSDYDTYKAAVSYQAPVMTGLPGYSGSPPKDAPATWDPYTDGLFKDNGISDAATGSFWFSGRNKKFFQLDDLFAGRSNDNQNPSAPLMKLTVGTAGLFEVPMALGFTFTSRCQILRPVAPQESGARNGPAQGKTRRTHQFAALMVNTQGISFGTDFDHLNAALFESPGGTRYTTIQMWNGVWWSPLDDGYTFDSMPCWEITRPYPATVVSFEGFLHTQDR